ncbi:transglycosylase family protein [Ruania suaedae]|uniref:resuscitation-promoting factor n=1 Tax=Ruania suaedae TaxID=2897774 RepID=UPI001E3ECB3C|nr:resuscitation-promoting factor [Ruania suaedae]UFU04572.1 transglycosylase family protein [Ruania suaedae]
MFRRSAPAAPTDESAQPAQSPPRNRRRTVIGVVAATALVLAGSGTAIAAAHKSVEVDLDGQTTSYGTFSGDVEGLLAEAGIDLGPHDEVVPGVEEALTDDTEVVVRTAQQLTITQDGEERTVWTTALSAAGALEALSAGGREASVVTSRSSGERAELDMPLALDGEVVVAVDGEERTVPADGGVTLAEVLLRAEVELGERDDATVTSEDGEILVTVTRRSSETETRTEVVEHESTERGTEDLYEGQSRVAREGQDGERTLEIVHQLVNGEIVSSETTSDEVTTEPVTEIVEVGTAERPAPEPEPEPQPEPSSSRSGGSSGGSGESSGSSAGSGVWAALAQCESGGNPQAVNPAGPYYGLYQFTQGTWQSVGGSGLPTEASAAEQTQRAQALQARSGWGQWPHCSAQLGLR